MFYGGWSLVISFWDTVNGPHMADGQVDHALIVTGRTTDGEIFVSYHTNDNKNRSMIDIRSAEPNANFYGDVVN